MNFETTSDNILIEILPLENRSAGGIILAPSNEKSNRGKVLAVGPGKLLKNNNLSPTSVRVDDIVLFDINQGTDLKITGKSYLVIGETDILGILN
jgi:chaperonin GroES